MTAPLFGAAAAVLLLCAGPDLLASRWSPWLLATTHCLVLGFVTTVMLGAVQQMLPVLAGGIIPRPRLVAGLVHWPWVPGVALLVFAFVRQSIPAFHAATVLIGGALLVFAGAVLHSLYRAEGTSDSARGMRLAVGALIVTVVLGVVLVLGLAGVLPLWRPRLTNLHLSWGLVGWLGLLVAAVAWQVVPMFQITPAYPRRSRLGAARAVLLLLVLKAVLTWPLSGSGADIAIRFIDALIACGLAGFAIITLRLQGQARRKVRDSHRDFWRLGMIYLVLAAAVWLIADLSGKPFFDLLAATLFLMGFVMAVITGMLLKIMAFLIWLHLQSLRDAVVQSGKGDFSVPKMKAVIPSRYADRLLQLLLVSQFAIVGAVFVPGHLATPAALLWFIHFCALGGILGYALYRYRRVQRIVGRLTGGTKR